jgi:hypothetical protein
MVNIEYQIVMKWFGWPLTVIITAWQFPTFSFSCMPPVATGLTCPPPPQLGKLTEGKLE